MTTPRTFLAAIAASAFFIMPTAEAAPVSVPEGSPVDAVALAAAVRANANGLELLVGAAEAGSTEAMNFLGVLYAIGTQVPRDFPIPAPFSLQVEGIIAVSLNGRRVPR